MSWRCSLHLDGCDVLLVVKLYIYVLSTFLWVSESNKRGKWPILSNVDTRSGSTKTETPAKWLSKVETSDEQRKLSQRSMWGGDLIGMGSEDSERRGVGDCA